MPGTLPVSNTGNPFTDGVMGEVKWAVTSLSFSFPALASFYGAGYQNGEPYSNFEALNTSQQNAARAAFAQFAGVANLSFLEITETALVHADLRLASSDVPNTAWAYLPTSLPEGGDAWFNNSSGNYDWPTRGNYAYATFIHELGHALGLVHPHEGPDIMPLSRDSIEYSIMSYRSYIGGSSSSGYVNETWGYAQTLMMYDIAALQHMYGANYSTNSGNTTYSWSAATGELYINGVAQGTPGGNRIFMTVWDGGGIDTYDFSNYTTSMTIDLRPGEWTTTSASQLARLHYNGSQIAQGNIANALMFNGDARSLIENAIGGSGNDRIIGNQAANTLAGGAAAFSWTVSGALNHLADFDGDGRSDIAQLRADTRAVVWLSTGTSLSQYSQWGSGVLPNDRIGDFNGDGRADIVQLYSNGNAYVWLSNGSSFGSSAIWGWGVTPNDRVGDFNGDGLDDVIQLYGNGRAYVWLSNGTGFNSYTTWGSGVLTTDIVGDFNGDGRADLLQLSSNGSAYVSLSSGSSFGGYTHWGSGTMQSDRIGDFNGDGLADIIQLYSNGKAYVWLSNGSGFDQYTTWGSGVLTTDRFGDFNGDGRDDVIQVYDGKAYVWLSNGSSFASYTTWGSGMLSTDRIVDMNGDGRDDLLRLDDNGTAFVWLSTGTGFGPRTAWGNGYRVGVVSGNDTFVFRPGFGHDKILDFEAGSTGGDVIEFSASMFGSFASVMANAVDTPDGVLITYDANNTLTLLNVARADLYHDDFTFV